MSEERILLIHSMLKKGLEIIATDFKSNIDVLSNLMDGIEKDDRAQLDEFTEEKLRELYNSFLVNYGGINLLSTLFAPEYGGNSVDQQALREIIEQHEKEKGDAQEDAD